MSIVSSLSHIFKKWYRKNLELPPGVPQQHHRWIVLAYHIDIFTIALVTTFMVIPIILNYWIVVSVDMALLMTIFLSIFLKQQSRTLYKQLVILLFMMTAMTTVIKTLLLGWHCGFEYYLLLLVQLSFYIPFFSKKTLFYVIATLILILILLYCTHVMVSPVFEIPSFWSNLLFFESLIGFTISLIYIPFVNNRANRVVFATLCDSKRTQKKDRLLSHMYDAFIIDSDDLEKEHMMINTSFLLPQLITESQRKKTLLAIDDEPINLQIIKNHLEPLGYCIMTAENGNSIIELINMYSPSVILLDIMLPGKNGYECCRTIRENYSISEMPIIFISAINRISDLVFGFEVGGNDYVLKPFLREELIARVEGQMQQKKTVDAMNEIARLKEELANRITEEAQLKQMQKRLTQLLHSVDDGLIVTNDNGEIIFANAIFESMLGITDTAVIIGRDISSLLHSEARQHNLMTAKLSRKAFTPVIFSNIDDSRTELQVKRLPLDVDSEMLIVFIIQYHYADIQHMPGKTSEWIISELEKNQARITELEILSAECIAANKRMMGQLIAGEFQSTDPFTLVNRIMIDTIALWKEATGKEKWDFAESSGLWKVHPDEDGWQRTATLDKYLDFRKMPKFPRWITVIESARFVLQEAKKRNFVSDKIKCIEQNVEELEGVLKGRVAA